MAAVPAESLPKRHYTVVEWEKLPEFPRYELIDGELILMARPSSEHQSITLELGAQFRNNLLGKRCRPFIELSVRFRENDSTVFIPDLIVVCDRSKIQKNYCIGAPDLVIEVLSPSTAKIDRILKLNRYHWEGVREYWMVEPSHQVLEVYQWDNGLCPPKLYGPEDKIKVGVLDDCEIDLSLVFPEPEESDN